MSLVSDLLPTVDSLRGLAASLGARPYTVGTVMRTWSGTEPGDGTASYVRKTLAPVPKVKDYSLNLNVHEGGYIQSGDLLLSGISLINYVQTDMDGGTLAKNQEFFFEVDGHPYRVVKVTKGLTDWQVLVRKTAEATA